MKFVHFKKLCALIATFTILSGCTTNRPVDKDFSFAGATEKALVIYGISVKHGHSALEPPENFFMKWRKYDPVTNKINNGSAKLMNFYGPKLETPVENVKYFINEIDTESYVLLGTFGVNVISKKLTVSYETYYTRARVADKKLHLYRTITKTKAPRFTAKAGEILYIGDFHFTWEGKGYSLETIKWNEADAKKFLSGYPNIKGRMLLKRPENHISYPVFGKRIKKTRKVVYHSYTIYVPR